MFYIDQQTIINNSNQIQYLKYLHLIVNSEYYKLYILLIIRSISNQASLASEILIADDTKQSSLQSRASFGNNFQKSWRRIIHIPQTGSQYASSLNSSNYPSMQNMHKLLPRFRKCDKLLPFQKHLQYISQFTKF